MREFPLEKNIQNSSSVETTSGTVGMLINGVEINNYKSEDTFYYGPLDNVNIVSGGEEYDVINPPFLEVSIENGNQAKIQPVISGSFENVFVDSQGYDIEKIVSIDISGGNGSGAVIEPVLVNQPRVILFDGKEASVGGGVNTTRNQIQFIEDHNFVNGEEIVYDSLDYDPIKIGTFSDFYPSPDGASYFVQVDNNTTITLYNTLSDQQTGVNTVGIYSGGGGIQKFSTAKKKNQVSYIKVLDKGTGYTNRKLIVDSTGISTENNTISFKNHGFESGELVSYEYETSPISGISTDNQYYILKIDDDTFKLCNAGVAGTEISEYERGDFSLLNSTGGGYQYFKYPDISVSIDYAPVGFGTTTQEYEKLITTPIVKGSIVDAYLYEKGTGYGSTDTINFEKKPIISIKNGKEAQLEPVIINGLLENVAIGYSGEEYYSIPDLDVIDSSGSGTGAQIRAVITNNQISDVRIINPGIGYSANSTYITITPSGKNAILDSKVRPLTINDAFSRFSSGSVLLNGNDTLQYSVVKYFTDLRVSFLETPDTLSNIIGWAYDGNPIYGPYSKEDPLDMDSTTKRLTSGYELDTSNIVDRPPGFDEGYFVEDYVFKGNGDLDEHNGRYEKTLDFPNGVYAYHATLDELNSPSFPYFIGNKYYSKPSTNSLDQSYDFNSSDLLRNTKPYNVSEEYADYDFITELSDIKDQKLEVDSVTSGSVESVEIVNSGDNYKVGDTLTFDNDGTFGYGLGGYISKVEGKNIENVITNSTLYLDFVAIWKSPEEIEFCIDPYHEFSSGDYVSISGFSTSLTNLNGFYPIEVPSYSTGINLSSITDITPGITTEIYVNPIPQEVSIGSSIDIGSERMKILAIYPNDNILRVERIGITTTHSVGAAVTFIPQCFSITPKNEVEKFDSKKDFEIYFNPRESLGVGTISGISTLTSFEFGTNTVTVDIPSQSVYIENHPFTTNQCVTYTESGTSLIVSTDGTSISPLSSPSELYVVNKAPNLIGLKTSISGSELFFHTNGDDDDRYKLETCVDNNQEKVEVTLNKVTVSVSTSHGLQNKDIIDLTLEPNLSVGIGTSTAVRVLYKSDIDNIVIDPIGFNSTGVSTTTNQISIIFLSLFVISKVFSNG